jgi:hypothetical protein
VAIERADVVQRRWQLNRLPLQRLRQQRGDAVVGQLRVVQHVVVAQHVRHQRRAFVDLPQVFPCLVDTRGVPRWCEDLDADWRLFE